MAMVRAEIATIRPLEEKVSALEESTNTVKRSLDTLEGGQQTTNSKLDKLVFLITKILSNTKEEGIEMDDRQAVKRTKASIK
jgi:hypothetical protein